MKQDRVVSPSPAERKAWISIKPDRLASHAKKPDRLATPAEKKAEKKAWRAMKRDSLVSHAELNRLGKLALKKAWRARKPNGLASPADLVYNLVDESILRLRRSPRLIGRSNPATGISTSALRRTSRRGMSLDISTLLHGPDSPRLLGKALRRSPRLLGKSAMTMPKCEQISPRKSPDNDVIDHKSPISSCTLSSFDLAKKLRDAREECLKPGAELRLDREIAATNFRSVYNYHSDKKEKMTCIHPGGVITWEGGDSSGFTYVAFRWMCVTCVVFKRTLEHVQDRLHPYLVHNGPTITCRLFGLTALNDIEVHANLTWGSRQAVVRGERIDEPFAIVSVDPSNTEKDPIKDEGQMAVLEYFQGLLKKDMVLGAGKIEEVGIRAFQLLCQKKFEPSDLWVSVATLSENLVTPETRIKFNLSKINNPDKHRAYLERKGNRSCVDVMFDG